MHDGITCHMGNGSRVSCEMQETRYTQSIMAYSSHRPLLLDFSNSNYQYTRFTPFPRMPSCSRPRLVTSNKKGRDPDCYISNLKRERSKNNIVLGFAIYLSLQSLWGKPVRVPNGIFTSQLSTTARPRRVQLNENLFVMAAPPESPFLHRTLSSFPCNEFVGDFNLLGKRSLRELVGMGVDRAGTLELVRSYL